MVLGGSLAAQLGSPLFPAVFSADGKHQIVVLSHQIRVYFLATRQCVRSVDTSIAGVVDVALNVSSHAHVLLFTASGAVFNVNWKEKVHNPVDQISTLTPPSGFKLATVSATSDKYAAVFRKSHKKGPCDIVVQTFTNDEPGAQVSLQDITGVFAWSLDKSQLVFVSSGHEAIHVTGIFDTELEVERFKFLYKSPVTAIAVSNDGVIALGTAAGPIQLIYFGGQDQRLLKWHIDLVKSLAFSADNKYLLSGGLEKVLVLWHLDSDNHQFLPRLNGIIDKINIDTNKTDCYSLLLGSNDGIHHEMLTISAVDLISRLTVNSARPRLVPNIENTLRRAFKKVGLADNLAQLPIRHDYTLPAAVHPVNKHLFFPAGANIQTYDWTLQEQYSLQNAAAVLLIGKVRSETKLVDPVVTHVSFTNDGSWMVTIDTVVSSAVDNLLSKNDEYYALKFWKHIDGKNEPSRWELACKIIDPHGHGKKLLSIKPAPSSNESVSFLSADDKGGVRIWRPQKNLSNSNQQTAWSLYKTTTGGITSSNAVDVCWSKDASAVFLAHDTSVTVLDGQKLLVISQLSGIADSPIRSLETVNDHLLVVSQTRIASYDLIRSKFSFIIRANFPEGARHITAIDHDSNLICVAANYYEKGDDTLAVKSKLFVFDHNNLQPKYTKSHDLGITSVQHASGSFLFVDLDARVGIITPSLTEYPEYNEEIKPDVKQIIVRAEERAQQESAHNVEHRAFDMNTFNSVFQNALALTLDGLFEKVVSITGRN